MSDIDPDDDYEPWMCDCGTLIEDAFDERRHRHCYDVITAWGQEHT